MKKQGFGHQKTRLFTVKTTENVGFGGPMVYTIYIYIYIIQVAEKGYEDHV